MEKEIVNGLLKEVLQDNKILFTKEELDCIKKNFNTIKKVYIIGVINSKEVYESNL